jgi:CBS domain-containing protein
MTIGALLDDRDGSIITIEATASVAEAIGLLAERRIGAMPVLRDGELAGIFSERDIIYGLKEHGAALLEWSVEQVMTSPPVTVERSQSLIGALGLITRRRVRHLPVVEDGRLIGFVSIGDIVKQRIDRIEREAESLRDYITHA